jgi:branched-chain amino acid transport system ATP-binding protein
MLKARGVTRKFGGLVAVSNVDFEIPRGSISAIIGPNGAGKTTFFNVIAGIYAPTSGTIELDGKPLISPPTGAGREPILLLVPTIPFRAC